MNMKKKIFTVTALLVLAGVSFGQQDAKAKEILDQMRALYKQMSAYRMELSSSVVNETGGVDEMTTGSFIFKGNKRFFKNKNEELYYDGMTLWFYRPQDYQVIITPDLKEIILGPIAIIDEIENGYTYLWRGQENEGGARCDVVDLIPNDTKDNLYVRIRMMISTEDKSLKKWVMDDKSGRQQINSMISFDGPISIEDSTFEFDVSKHPGVEVIYSRRNR